MKRLPGSREVDRAFAAVLKELKAALRGLNQQTTKTLERGDYSSAEEAVGLGRSVSEFSGRVDALRAEWRTLQRSTRKNDLKEEHTPLWRYYQPILETLIELDGEATREELEKAVEPRVRSILKPGDEAKNSRGLSRWRVMVRRAKRPMAHEGFIEDSRGRWRVTAKGRKASQSGIAQE